MWYIAHNDRYSIVGTCKYTHKHITLNTFRNLTWHDGALPQEQLWVKLGGHKGHGSFKLNLQLCNIQNPNSRQNTCLVSVFMSKDTRANLWTALQPYREQLMELEGMNLGFAAEYYLYMYVLCARTYI